MTIVEDPHVLGCYESEEQTQLAELYGEGWDLFHELSSYALATRFAVAVEGFLLAQLATEKPLP